MRRGANNRIRGVYSMNQRGNAEKAKIKGPNPSLRGPDAQEPQDLPKRSKT